MAKLVIYLGETRYREVELGPRSFRIGRADENDIVLSDPERSVSRHHAELRFENGRYTIVDLGSANGIWVADQQVKQAQVEPGVPIEVGTYRLVLVAEQPSAPAAPAPAKVAPPPAPPKPVAPKPEPARPSPAPPTPPPAPLKPTPPAPEPPKPAAAKAAAKKPQPAARRTWWYAAAAVLVIGVAAAGFYFWQSDRTLPPDTSAQTGTSPVEPSGGTTPPAKTPSEVKPTETKLASAAKVTAPKQPTVPRAPKTTAAATREKPVAASSEKKPAPVPPPTKPPAKPPAVVTERPPTAPPARPAKTAPQIPTDPKARARELQRIYQASREAIIKGDYLAAIEGFETVLKVDPAYLDAKEMLGIARGGAKNAAQLEVDYGTKAEMEGDWAEAIKRFNRALELDSTATSPVDGIKRVYARMQIEGEELFKRARQLDAADRAADAVSMYEKALALLPKDHPNAKVAVERIAQLRKDA